nr:MAG TPA: pentapeptide repeat protein [Caudoviricetes sp.]
MEQTNQPVKGYKVFNPDWTCRGFQYEVGKTFDEDVTPECCEAGFHFCTKASDCFNYYRFDSNNKVAEVLALGEVDSRSDDTKCCTNKIQIVREISWQELLTIVNTGKSCTGLCNTGNWNTGNWNTGDWNTGKCNTGDCNTGDWNTGDRNTGDWNIASASSGCFCTENQKILIFDKPSDWTIKDWWDSDARCLLNQIPKSVAEWIYSSNMTDEEKEKYPTHETTGGYLKVLNESESAQIWWNGLSEKNKETIKSIPNFDVEKFEKCTGIKVGE